MEKIIKKAKIQSRSNSADRSNINSEEWLKSMKPTEDYFTSSIDFIIY
jgi:hypothetical protein